MTLSKEMNLVVEFASEYAEKNKFEYVTPEMMMLGLTDQEDFRYAFEECDGDVEELTLDLVTYCEKYVDKSSKKEPVFSDQAAEVIGIAGAQAKNAGLGEIEVRHFLYALSQLKNSHAIFFMEKQGVSLLELLATMQGLFDDLASEWGGDLELFPEDEDFFPEPGFFEAALKERDKKPDSSVRDRYAPCLNDTLGKVNPLIGREEELERTMEILCRKDKNNPLYIGEPGVGKTAIVYGLVQRLIEKKVPKPLLGSRVFALDLGGMLAGTQYRGDFEKRFKKVLASLEEEEKPIVFIDEIHTLSGAGAVGDSSFDAANLLKPYLSFGHIRFIGATTFDEYKKHFEHNRGLVRRFQNIEVKEPDEEETIQILKGLQPDYEAYHGVTYQKGVLEYAVSASARHINERFLPDKAIDLMDEAGAYRKLHPLKGKGQTVDREVVNRVLTKICRVPIETVEADEVSKLETLEERLKSQVFGQNEAIAQAVNAVKFSRAGLLEENKPLASLLFVGPTGVGKTEVARTLAKELGVKLVRFDMSEYEEKHAVSKLIGSPAGYVGYEDGGLLTSEIRKAPSCVLLLDEIEKAHPDIFNILLQVMDYATLTDNQGRKADFRNVVLIMTSNVGANRLGKKGIGFNSDYQDSGVLKEEVKKAFSPEFRNRLNKIVSFHSMDDEMGERIIEKKLKELNEMLKKKSIRFTLDKPAKDLLKKRGISQEFGAREVDRVIRNDVKPLFVDEILFGSLKNGGKLTLTVKDDEFAIK